METVNDILRAWLQAQRRIAELLRGHFGQMNLTYPQTLVLTILDTEGPMPISTLAQAAGSANSTISGVVDRLSAMGLTERVRSEADRRVIFVQVTDEYARLRREAQDYAMQRVHKAFSSLTEEEIVQVKQGLALVAKVLDTKKEEEKKG